jgi:membrane protein implicated in regulation of membrane protease activity
MTSLTRYALFQIPGWILAAVVCAGLWSVELIPAWAAGGLFAVWVVKDVMMYPLVREAYRPAPTGAETLVGERGVVRERGYVEVRGTLWRAAAAGGASVRPGQRVTVCGAKGLTVFVEPDEQPGGHQPSSSELRKRV